MKDFTPVSQGLSMQESSLGSSADKQAFPQQAKFPVPASSKFSLTDNECEWFEPGSAAISGAVKAAVA